MLPRRSKQLPEDVITYTAVVGVAALMGVALVADQTHRAWCHLLHKVKHR
jgi:hypothetical protein